MCHFCRGEIGWWWWVKLSLSTKKFNLQWIFIYFGMILALVVEIIHDYFFILCQMSDVKNQESTTFYIRTVKIRHQIADQTLLLLVCVERFFFVPTWRKNTRTFKKVISSFTRMNITRRLRQERLCSVDKNLTLNCYQAL